MTELILASSSRRRQALLKQLYLDFKIIKPNVDETIINEVDPRKKVQALAHLKSESIDNNQDIILTCDTLISFEDKILEKPKHIAHAKKMLEMLSGKTHTVLSAALLRQGKKEHMIVNETEVTFYHLTNEEIESYINTKEPYDKAAGYGIQAFGASFVKSINGDYNTIVGLPLAAVYRALKTF